MAVQEERQKLEEERLIREKEEEVARLQVGWYLLARLQVSGLVFAGIWYCPGTGSSAQEGEGDSKESSEEGEEEFQSYLQG